MNRPLSLLALMTGVLVLAGADCNGLPDAGPDAGSTVADSGPGSGPDAGGRGDGGSSPEDDAGPNPGADAGAEADAGKEPQPDAGTQPGPDAGAPDAGADVDAGAPIDAGPTYGDDPARCGTAPYTWLSAEQMGNVLEAEQTNTYNALVLLIAVNDLENNGDITLQRNPEYDVKVHRLRYQTQDKGELVDATGMLAIPDLDSPETLPVLLFLHGTVGISDPCSPSLDPSFGGTTSETSLVLGLLASFGYVVVAPDYLGLKSLGDPSPRLHSYLVGEPTAIASLDMVRAAQQYVPTVEASLSLGPLLVSGASQGGHAAAFTTRFQPHYAPDLPITAAVYGIPPTDLTSHMEIALTSVSDPTANAVAFGLGAEGWYEAADGGVSSYFRAPWDTDLPPYAEANCGLDILDGVTMLDELFAQPLLDATAQPGLAGYAPWDCYLAENSLTTTTVPRLDEVPALFVIGSNDTLVDSAVERASFQTLCSQGYELEFLECDGAGHTEGFLFSLDDQFDFLEARLDGDPLPADLCQITPAVTCSSQPAP